MLVQQQINPLPIKALVLEKTVFIKELPGEPV
jgi:hypothetical protein